MSLMQSHIHRIKFPQGSWRTLPSALCTFCQSHYQPRWAIRRLCRSWTAGRLARTTLLLAGSLHISACAAFQEWAENDPMRKAAATGVWAQPTPAEIDEWSADVSVVDSLRVFLSQYAATFSPDAESRTTEFEGGWAKERFEALEFISVGQVFLLRGRGPRYSCEATFLITRTYTDLHSGQVGALRDNDFANFETLLHWHKYEMSRGQWYATERHHETLGDGRWANCNEFMYGKPIVKERNAWGCWE